MTNFEKWKNELTPEKLMYTGFNAGEPYRTAAIYCSNCPAESCRRKTPGCIGRDAICGEEFLKWAAGPDADSAEEVIELWNKRAADERVRETGAGGPPA